MAELKAVGIAKSFGDKAVLRDVNITVREHEIVALLGVSGVGKSTLFHILSGLSQPDSGTVLLDNEDITGKTGRISYMQQKDLLLPHKKILDNVILPLTLRGVSRQKAREAALARLEEFGLQGTEDKYPSQLSGGMRQRAAFLRTCLFSGKAALLDEPFSALDAITKRRMHMWFLELMEHMELATVFVTHDIDEAVFLSDRVLIMAGRPGSITAEIQIGAPRPRDAMFSASPAYMAHKRAILEALGEQYYQ